MKELQVTVTFEADAELIAASACAAASAESTLHVRLDPVTGRIWQKLDTGAWRLVTPKWTWSSHGAEADPSAGATPK